MAPRFTEEEARKAIAESRSWAQSLRRLGYCHTGANPETLKKWTEIWEIDTSHFDPAAVSNEALRRSNQKTPLTDVLVKGSTYNRSHLKRRLYEEGLKKPECELCGQGEIWRGKRISLILDHINGDRTNNRLENLRIVCPNCAATLETHCGGNKQGHPKLPAFRKCAACRARFSPKYWDHRYCSRKCGTRARHTIGVPLPARRKVKRPPHRQLLREVLEMGYRAVGRKYGVSDTAVRKWLRQYERERAIREGRDPKVVEIPTRTWPNQRQDRKAA
jgi:transposase-like protein